MYDAIEPFHNPERYCSCHCVVTVIPARPQSQTGLRSSPTLAILHITVGELYRRERGMAGTTPMVHGELLTWRTAGIDHMLRVGSADWFTWLEGATSFAY